MLSSEVALMTQIYAMKSQASEPSRWPLALAEIEEAMECYFHPCVLLHRVVFRYSGNFTLIYLNKILRELF